MSIKPTQKPVPSNDIKDLLFNAGLLDEWATSLEKEYIDRFGTSHLTAVGMEWAFNQLKTKFESEFDTSQADKESRFQQFLLSSGYQFLGDYEQGPWQFSSRNQYIRYDNQYWRLAPSAPTNFATTGITVATFEVDKLSLVLMDGDAIRQGLAGSDGFKLIGKVESFEALRKIKPERVGQEILLGGYAPGWAILQTQSGAGKFIAIEKGDIVDDGGIFCIVAGSDLCWRRSFGPEEYPTPQMYGGVANYDGISGTDISPFIQKAIDGAISIGLTKVFTPSGRYYAEEGYIELAGSGHNRVLGVVVYGNSGDRYTGGTKIYFKAAENRSPLFVSKSPSSWVTGHSVSHLEVEAHPSSQWKGIVLQGIGTCHMKTSNVVANFLYDSIQFINSRAYDTDTYIDTDGTVKNEGDDNGYCEFNTITGWISNRCQNAFSFTNDGTGDPSLHATAFIDCKVQLKELGNGLNFEGNPNGKGLLWYNSPGNTIKFFGQYDASLAGNIISLAGTEVRNVSGQMTAEGYVNVTCSAFSFFKFDGDFIGFPEACRIPLYTGVAGENSLGDARVIFNNTTSRDRYQMASTPLAGITRYSRPLPTYSQGAKATTNTPMPQIFRMTNSPDFRPLGTGAYEGIGVAVYRNSKFCFFETQSQSVWANSDLTMAIDVSVSAFESYYSGFVFRMFTPSGVPLSNASWTMGSSFYPDLAGSTIGVSGHRVTLYGTSFEITDSGLFPVGDKTKDIGRNSAAVKDIYLANSPIITSDREDKDNETDISAKELECAIACGKLYKRYQMKDAIARKGVETARFHVGVIAQDLIQCFTDHGLDWTRYGMIVYEKWEAKDAVIESWDADIRVIPAHVNEEGENVPEETIVIREAGSVVKEDAIEAGEGYKVRYDELNCFINSGLVSLISSLETK